MKTIIALTDYKNNFGSKYDAIPYNSGFDKKLLSKYFNELNYKINFIEFSKATELKDLEDVPIIYTSSEDVGYHYKSYIEDVVLFLQESGAQMLPGYNFLRANNNKVYMELLRSKIGGEGLTNLKSWAFGTLEEMKGCLDEFSYPIVIKTASGAMSKGVSLAKSEDDLINKVKSISRTKHLREDIKDKLRPQKHKGYMVNSLYRNKFILQSFISNLKNDWKILIFGDKYFILTRHVQKGDFRASGSKENYLAGSKALLPDGLLDYTENVFSKLDVPHLSIDIVFDGISFYVIEYQALYFGSSTYNMSDIYYKKVNDKWVSTKNTELIEKIYAESVVSYLFSDKQ